MTVQEANAILTPPLSFDNLRIAEAASFLAEVKEAVEKARLCISCPGRNDNVLVKGQRCCRWCGSTGQQQLRGPRVGHEGHQDAKQGCRLKRCSHCDGRGWRFCSCLTAVAARSKEVAMAAIEQLYQAK
ncbi:MAG TPA: hypothetical protein VGR84_19080 [Candidatus Acidoferrales bacterium]|nr:hypothetical protein [Candidatus Acidoferrales bacterium]